MKKTFIILLISICYLFTVPALAQETPNQPVPGGQSAVGGLDETAQQAGLTNDPSTAPSVSVIIGMIINAVLSLIGVIFLIIIIVSGFKWMTAGGNEETITKAKKNLSNAVIGLMVIFAAFIITNFVVFQVLQIMAIG
jgi:flagellar basal body-associated protein FliL